MLRISYQWARTVRKQRESSDVPRRCLVHPQPLCLRGVTRHEMRNALFLCYSVDPVLHDGRYSMYFVYIHHWISVEPGQVTGLTSITSYSHMSSRYSYGPGRNFWCSILIVSSAVKRALYDCSRGLELYNAIREQRTCCVHIVWCRILSYNIKYLSSIYTSSNFFPLSRH